MGEVYRRERQRKRLLWGPWRKLKGNDCLLEKIVQDNRKRSKRRVEAVHSLRMALEFSAFATFSLLLFSQQQ